MMITSLYFWVRMQFWYTSWLAWFLKIKPLNQTSPGGTGSEVIVWSLPNFSNCSKVSPAVSCSSLSWTQSFTEWQVKVSVSPKCKVKRLSRGKKNAHSSWQWENNGRHNRTMVLTSEPPYICTTSSGLHAKSRGVARNDGPKIAWKSSDRPHN